MSSVRGYGRFLGMLGNSTSRLAGFASIFPPSTVGDILQDWTFQPGPPVLVEIPYGWLGDVLRYRQEKPLTTATVSGAGGTARERDITAIAEYGDNPFSAELDTACTSDPANLAKHIIDFYAQAGQIPRSRMSAMTIQMVGRTQAEIHRILSITQGQRIRITGAPGKWPAGMTEQVVEGIGRSYSDGALVTFLTSPVIGTDPGDAGPWFRLDVSALDGTDIVPF